VKDVEEKSTKETESKSEDLDKEESEAESLSSRTSSSSNSIYARTEGGTIKMCPILGRPRFAAHLLGPGYPPVPLTRKPKPTVPYGTAFFPVTAPLHLRAQRKRPRSSIQFHSIHHHAILFLVFACNSCGWLVIVIVRIQFISCLCQFLSCLSHALSFSIR